LKKLKELPIETLRLMERGKGGHNYLSEVP